MKTYCVKGRKDTESVDPKPKNLCSVCGIKNSRFVKEQEPKGSLSNLGIKTPLSKIPLLNALI